MSKTVRHIINTTSALLLAAALCVAFIAGVSCRAPLTCKGLNVVISDSLTNRFVSAEDVRKYIDSEFGEYVGCHIDSIDLRKVEEILDGKSAVLKSEAYTTKDSMLNVTVTQKKPVVRFQKGTKGFYAVEDCSLFPLQSTYTSHVMVVDGHIPLKIEHGYLGKPDTEAGCRWLNDIVELVKYIEASKTWKSKIVQITVLEDSDLLLIPRVGQERFLFGQPCDIEEKFEKMGIYYRSIQYSKGEGAYRTVDLRFKDQIVCRKD
jgi:cell division protein FtsQ